MTGPYLRRWRLELALRQSVVAQAAGVDPGNLCRTEMGLPNGLSPAAVQRVAEVLRAEQTRIQRERAAAELGRAIREQLVTDLMEATQ